MLPDPREMLRTEPPGVVFRILEAERARQEAEWRRTATLQATIINEVRWAVHGRKHKKITADDLLKRPAAPLTAREVKQRVKATLPEYFKKQKSPRIEAGSASDDARERTD